MKLSNNPTEVNQEGEGRNEGDPRVEGEDDFLRVEDVERED